MSQSEGRQGVGAGDGLYGVPYTVITRSFFIEELFNREVISDRNLFDYIL